MADLFGMLAERLLNKYLGDPADLRAQADQERNLVARQAAEAHAAYQPLSDNQFNAVRDKFGDLAAQSMRDFENSDEFKINRQIKLGLIGEGGGLQSPTITTPSGEQMTAFAPPTGPAGIFPRTQEVPYSQVPQPGTPEQQAFQAFTGMGPQQPAGGPGGPPLGGGGGSAVGGEVPAGGLQTNQQADTGGNEGFLPRIEGGGIPRGTEVANIQRPSNAEVARREAMLDEASRLRISRNPELARAAQARFERMFAESAGLLQADVSREDIDVRRSGVAVQAAGVQAENSRIKLAKQELDQRRQQYAAASATTMITSGLIPGITVGDLPDLTRMMMDPTAPITNEHLKSLEGVMRPSRFGNAMSTAGYGAILKLQSQALTGLTNYPVVMQKATTERQKGFLPSGEAPGTVDSLNDAFRQNLAIVFLTNPEKARDTFIQQARFYDPNSPNNNKFVNYAELAKSDPTRAQMELGKVDTALASFGAETMLGMINPRSEAGQAHVIYPGGGQAAPNPGGAAEGPGATATPGPSVVDIQSPGPGLPAGGGPGLPSAPTKPISPKAYDRGVQAYQNVVGVSIDPTVSPEVRAQAQAMAQELGPIYGPAAQQMRLRNTPAGGQPGLSPAPPGQSVAPRTPGPSRTATSDAAAKRLIAEAEGLLGTPTGTSAVGVPSGTATASRRP